MAWHLATDVHVARIGPDLVFLDVVGDAYHCMAGAAAVFHRRSYGVDIDDPGVHAALLAAGLITERPSASVSRPLPSLPTADLGAGPRVRPRPADWPRMGRSALTASGLFHRAPLAKLLRRSRSRRIGSRASLAVDPRLLEEAQRFARLLPWAPVDGPCLFRSIFLLEFLGEAAPEVAWVFGVRTWPFEAHCWVQAGDIVLDDDLDRVRTYTPIMAT